MLTASLALLLVSAVFHAVAQAMIASGRDKQAYAWLMLGAASLLGLPLLFTLDFRATAPAGWGLVAASGALEALYYSVLTKAYELGDFSSVYPISRGSGPLFVLLWAAIFLGERPSAAGLFGIFLVVVGIYLVNLPALSAWRRPFTASGGAAAAWALATGLVISLYTTVDKVGVRYFPPANYVHLVMAVAWLLMAPRFLGPKRRAAAVAELTRTKDGGGRALDLRSCGRLVLCSALALGAYGLVLAALRLSPASYVAPTREISVVLASWIGVRRFGERGGRLRVFAALLIMAGVAVIALAR